jgi:hypothetical protein
LYSYLKNKTPFHIIYFWLGKYSTADEKGSAALLAKELSDSLGGKASQVRVVQGKEPLHFRLLFKGGLVIHSGGGASGFKNIKSSDSFDTDGVALFRLHGTNANDTVALQVAEVASSLNSQDVFVLVNSTHVYVWCGTYSNESEATVGAAVAAKLAGGYLNKSGREVVKVAEGEEPAELWSALGGKDEYAAEAPVSPQHHNREARLFAASTASGTFDVEEIFQFSQTDMNDEDVFILDVYSQVFVWIGSQSTEEEKGKSLALAGTFMTEADDGRDPDAAVVVVAASNEPHIFTRYFVDWDDKYFSSAIFKDPYQQRLQQINAAK